MYTVLIVDDARLIRVSISKRVNWEGLGLSIVGTASNGLEAIQLIEQKSPDIVITDIRMPLMDGLALIKEVQLRKIKPIKFVIISGYNDFEYARQAIRLGVSDYIQKPIDEEDLEKTLRSLVAKLDSEQMSSEQEESIMASGGHAGVYDEVSCYATLSHKQLYVIANRIRDFTGPDFILVNAIAKADSKPMLALDELGTEIRAAMPACQLFPLVSLSCPNHLCQLVSGAGLSPSAIAEKLQRNGHFSVAISPVFADPADFWKYSDLVYVNLVRRLFTDQSIFVCVCEMVPTPDRKTLQTFMSLVKRLEELIDNQDMNGISDQMDQILFRFIEPAASPILLDRFVSTLSTHLSHAMGSLDPGQPSGLNSSILLTTESLADLQMTLLSAIYHTFSKNEEKRPTDYATQVKTYIEDHFDQNLSLKSLSDHFHLNASYLSQLFRQRCGKCLTEYIESVRIDKSKNWLETTDMTVAETALRTGYADANYFSKVFKKNTGISPTDYQREHGRRGTHSHRTADA